MQQNTLLKDRIKILMDSFEFGSRTEFGKKIGASQQAVSSYISGRFNPGKDKLKKICEVYKIEKQWLETGEGPMQRGPEEVTANKLSVNEHDEYIKYKALYEFMKENQDKFWGIVLSKLDSCLESRNHPVPTRPQPSKQPSQPQQSEIETAAKKDQVLIPEETGSPRGSG